MAKSRNLPFISATAIFFGKIHFRRRGSPALPHAHFLGIDRETGNLARIGGERWGFIREYEKNSSRERKLGCFRAEAINFVNFEDEN